MRAAEPGSNLIVSKPLASPTEADGPEAAHNRSFVVRARSSNGPGKAAGNPAVGTRALRTREHLIATARQVFLRLGYDATSIESIAEAAGVSRASVYTYFSSKRDVLLEVGTSGVSTSFAMLSSLGDLPENWDVDDVDEWVKRYFGFLEDHGGYMLVWLQAARSDENLRNMGMRGSMRAARLAGAAMRKLGAPTDGDPMVQGLALMALLDRFWYHWRITKVPIKSREATRGLARMITAIIRDGADEGPAKE